MTSLIVTSAPRAREHLHSIVHLTNPCTKPKGKIYKTKNDYVKKFPLQLYYRVTDVHNSSRRINGEQRHRNDLFLKNYNSLKLMKTVFYDKVLREKQWIDEGESSLPTLKAKLNERKFMLCGWTNHLWIIYFEFLNRNQTLNEDLFSQELQCWPEKFSKKGSRPNNEVKTCASPWYWSVLPYQQF